MSAETSSSSEASTPYTAPTVSAETSSSSEASTPYTAPTTPSSSPSSWDEFSQEAEKARADGISAEHIARWRPGYHVMPSRGWMNDPCGPGYDPRTKLYHVAFQWNPNSADWGSICWGSATSPDMVHWTINERPSMSPDQPYDEQGVFTGCLIPTNGGHLTCAYTSVSRLPIHYTIPHPKGCESLSFATSTDGGKTWKKAPSNPILPSEPEHLDVTGWRDPFVAPWDSMSELLGRDPEHTLFGIISGGIRDNGPTTFLYAVNASNMQWEYLGPLTNYGMNFSPSRWSGDLGCNWEVTNFLSLKDRQDGSTRDFLVMGTEGNIPRPAPSDWEEQARSQLWLSGRLEEGKNTATSGVADMTYQFGGHLDHGSFYAANSFFDPISHKHIVWGWITEDDLTSKLRHRQGWSGLLSMPRELHLQTTRNVVGAWKSDLSSITCIEAEEKGSGLFTARTLSSQPLENLVQELRHAPDVRKIQLGRSSLESHGGEVGVGLEDAPGQRWELDCSFLVSRRCRRIGVRMAHSEDSSEATTLAFYPPTETFHICRPALDTPHSTKLINSAPERAPHTLFVCRDPETGVTSTENLHIRAFRDGSVLEVFVNGRTVISTRLYGANETFNMHFFAEEADRESGGALAPEGSELVGATIWDGLEVS